MRDPLRTKAPGRRDCDARGLGPGEIGLGLLGSLVALLVPLAVLAMPPSDVVAVVGTPGADIVDLARVVAQADGAILGSADPDNVILARSDRAGFAARLYAAGAGLVLDAGRAEGCGRPSVRAVADATPITTGTPTR